MKSTKENYFLNRQDSEDKKLSSDLKNFEQKNIPQAYTNKTPIKTFNFINKIANRKELENILSWTFRNYGAQKACLLADLLKEIGFKYATKGGISISIEDLKVPRIKNRLLEETNTSLHLIELKYKRGEITDAEWFQKRIASWNVTSEAIKSEIINYFEKTDPLNPVYMMAFSGARGNISQVRQLIGMRGLMSDQKGEIIGLPIQKNFREGLRITDFIISSYGARKGLVDTAIRTADSGYLTRRLIDIAQDVIIRQFDCRTKLAISIHRDHKDPKFKISFADRILGRILSKSIYDPENNQKLADLGQEIDFYLANLIEKSRLNKVSIRSPLTCQSSRSICQKCYGWDLAQAKLIRIGEAVGIIAAQSIGEPGTQLTMRTFHTGGIFTSELGQEIRITLSGQINFSPSLKSRFVRTMDGDYAQIIEKSSFVEVTDYKNAKVKFHLNRDSVLFIKNKDFVKKDQIIGQLPLALKNESEEQTEKEIYSKFSGEIFYQFKKKYNFFEYNSIIWVLSSNIYKLPFNAKTNLRLFTSQKTKQSIGKTKLVGKYRTNIQKVTLSENKSLQLTESFEFFDDSKLYLNSNPITQTIDNIIYILVDKKNNKISLNSFLNSNIYLKTNLLIGDLLTSSFLTKTGGIIHNLNLRLTSNKMNSYQEILNGGSLLWIAEEVYPLNRDAAVLLVENASLVHSGMEIAKNIFCKNNGILFIKEKTKIIQDISIKIGKIYSFLKESLNLKNFLYHFDHRFFFPGETILTEIPLQHLVFSEVILLEDTIQLILRPVIQYNVSKPKTYRSKAFKTKKNQKPTDLYGRVEYKKFLLTKDNDRIGSSMGLNLVRSEIYFSLYENNIQKEGKIATNFYPKDSFSKKTKVVMNKVENFSVFDKLPTQIKKQNSFNCFLVKKNQWIEPYTSVSSFHIADKKFQKIYQVESKYSKYQEIAIISEKDITEYYLDEKDATLTKNQFLFEEDFLAQGIKTKTAGKIFSKIGSIIQLRHGKPYLFSEGAIIQKNHHDFVLKDDSLGLLRFKILKTEDIVQGLPKIEEILEARVPKKSAFLIENPGFVTHVVFDNSSKNLTLNILMLSAEPSGLKTISEVPYLFGSIENCKMKNFQLIHLGQPINEGVINSHDVLTNYFYYFQKRDSLYRATLRSLNKLASLLIEAIQSIYYSQGIRISDKHIEVILRQMMARVEVEEPGDTPFLPGEFMNLKQIKIVNEMLRERNKKLVYYKPVILGLTKASLNTESFISAASFQETRRVLSKAAIEGKIDWLRGLKENVIIGRLIPAGTGFSTMTDLSTRLLSSRIKSSS